MGAVYTNYFRKDHITLIIFYAGLCYFSYTGHSTHPCAIVVAAQAQSPQRSFMRFHVFGSPFNDVVDTAAPRAVSGSDASSTYITWPPRALPLSQNRLPHSDAMCIATPCGTSSSFGWPRAAPLSLAVILYRLS